MSTVRYRKAGGDFRVYPQSFNFDELEALAEFLDAAQDVVPLRDVARGMDGWTKVAVRHDVDHNIEHAAKFARWEASWGFRSTYFVLHTAWYYEDRLGLLKYLHELQDLGHEVGLHNDTVAATWRASDAMDGSALPAGHCQRAADLMAYELEFLRDNGIEVVGTAAHGTGLFKQHGIHNNDIWASGFTPADFGLEYEAYHLHRGAHYISDNRGKWQAPFADGDPFDVPSDQQTHILIHPCHWRLD